jgi:tetratricopeptide (TPR) repeat protein
VSLDLVSGDLDEALQILQNHHFRKVEGVGNIHNLWVDAWLAKGKHLLGQGDVEGAISCFERSLEYPRNLDIGENSREGQSHYFIALAYQEAKDKQLAQQHFTTAVSEDFGDHTSFYKGQALLKLGKKEDAMKVFDGLISKGDEILSVGENQDYFAKFGDQEASNVNRAQGYSLKGLGFWGLNKKAEAEKLFEKALEQDPSNFVANSRLFE